MKWFGKKKEIKDLMDVDLNSQEGKIIIALISMVSCEGRHTKETPDMILREAISMARTFV